jgi:pimeloyl-ACP methyl ester carboxylesterase
MKKVGKVDEKRVYLIGGSGGGHATLLLAGRHPELWTAVSAWCPISDIAAWHNECTKINPRYKSYARHIERACGGNPQTDPKAKAQAVKRSPLTYLNRAAKLKVDINAGIHDGHKGSVLTSHSLNAFNILAAKKDQLSAEEINSIVRDRKVPEKFGTPETDPSFGENTILFRRQSNLTRVTLFEGGHDCLPGPGLAWLARQNRKKAPDWSVGKAAGSGSFELGQ